MYWPIVWICIVVAVIVLAVVFHKKVIEAITRSATQVAREIAHKTVDARIDELKPITEGEAESSSQGGNATQSPVYESVPDIKIRKNSWLLFPLVIQLIAVVVIWSLTSGFGDSGWSWQGFAQGLAKAGLLELGLALLIKPQRVEQRRARGIEFLGRPVAIALEGLVFLWRWERLSTKLGTAEDTDGKKVTRAVPHFVTSRMVTIDMEPEDVHDEDMVPFKVQMAMKYEVVWTEQGIVAALYGFEGDIEMHIDQSLRSALADFAGSKKVKDVPSSQKELEASVETYFKKEALDFVHRFGYKLKQAEYKGLTSRFSDALAAGQIKKALAAGDIAEAEGKKRAAMKGTDARVYDIEESGKAEAKRRKMLAKADAKRLEQAILQMAGSNTELAQLSAEDRRHLAERAADYLGTLDYNAAIKTGAADESTVVFASQRVPGVQLDEAALRSVVYRVMHETLPGGNEAENGPAAAGAAAGQ